MKKFLAGAAALFCLFSCSACSLEIFATGVEPGSSEASCLPPLDPTLAPPPSKLITVVSLGWHTGILISSADVTEPVRAGIEEFRLYPAAEVGWGDTGFYMSSGYSTWKGIKAAFFSASSSAHVAGFDSDLGEFLAGADVVRLRISEDGFGRLMSYINDHLQRDDRGMTIPLGESLYGRGHFYASSGRTSLFHTCNSWTSEMLRAAGCDVPGNYLRASSLMRRLKRPGGAFIPAGE